MARGQSLYDWCMENGERGQQLLQEFQGIDVDGKVCKATEICKGTRKKVLWRCSKGHLRYTQVYSRILGYNCALCDFDAKSVPSDGKDLQSWCINNGDYGKQLLNEFQGISKDNIKYKATEVAYSSRKIMLWKCENGHEWYEKIAKRTYEKSKCIRCIVQGTSYPEQFLYRALLQIYPNTISRGKFQGIEYDITIPEEKTCIEYSGYNWHKDKVDRDTLKYNIYKEHNVRFIQIYAHNGELYTADKLDSDIMVYYADRDEEKHNKTLKKILSYILETLNHSISEIDIEKAQTEAFSFMHSMKIKEVDNNESSSKNI